MKKMPDKYSLPQWEIDKAYSLAEQLLQDEPGKLEDSPHDYQCFTFKAEGVCLIFYPHRTSSMNYHIRVRNQGSKNKEKADELMKLLDEGAGSNCTFSSKN